MMNATATLNIENNIKDWIEASNAFDTKKYINFYSANAILDDHSVGRKFIGEAQIEDYYETYFTGFHTRTTVVDLKIADETHAHVKVEFAGNFPEEVLGGTFDFTFEREKIVHLTADLIQY